MAHDIEHNTEHNTEHGGEPQQRHGLEPREYILIAVVLTLITAVELAASYSADLGFDLGQALIPVLIALSAVKFAGVVAFFMHLRFESPLFARAFLGSLVLAGAVLLALVSLFWTDFTDVI